MEKNPLGRQQSDLLRFVAENAPLSVAEVAERFGLPRGLARTTVLTMMEKLREKGYLRREKEGALFRYRTVEEPGETLNGLVAEFVDRTLGGSVSPMVAYLARAKGLTPEELTELKQMVATLEHDAKGNKDK
ncbi:MAG: BlaI/MecI/CopY family transcriptional regulator [Akkermansiaceae bacterium]|nr:BlaI/MecI/CopY family transcriptional regulator [Armatimonadota bacterium]